MHAICSVKHIQGSDAQRNCPVHGFPRGAGVSGAGAAGPPPVTRAVTTGSSEQRLSPQQEAFFRDTHVTTPDGFLATAYHGSRTEFDAFDEASVGRGTDAWGNGFYFAERRSVSEAYAADGGVVRAFYLNITNPIFLDGKTDAGMRGVEFSPEEVLAIVSKHPAVRAQPTDEEVFNPLGDYCHEFWSRESHTDEQFDEMIADLASRVGREWSLVEGFFGRDYGAEFLHAVHEATGHDGVIVDFGPDEGRFFIAWFANQAKLTSTLDPDDTDRL